MFYWTRCFPPQNVAIIIDGINPFKIQKYWKENHRPSAKKTYKHWNTFRSRCVTFNRTGKTETVPRGPFLYLSHCLNCRNRIMYFNVTYWISFYQFWTNMSNTTLSVLQLLCLLCCVLYTLFVFWCFIRLLVTSEFDCPFGIFLILFLILKCSVATRFFFTRHTFEARTALNYKTIAENESGILNNIYPHPPKKILYKWFFLYAIKKFKPK